MISDVVAIPDDSLLAHDRRLRLHGDSGTALREFLIGPENSAILKAFEFQDSKGPILSDKNLNPIVVHGRVGVGKSHLLQVLNLLAEPSGSAILSDSNSFSADVTKSSKLGVIDELRARYGRAKFLFFDDLHYLTNKTAAQQQLAFVLQHRSADGLLTVLTAKQAPNRLDLSPFLTSRLSPGVVVRLKAPTRQTRLQLIKILARQLAIELTPDAADFLAEACQGTALQLKQAMLEISRKENESGEISIEQVCGHLRKSAKIKIEPKRVIRETAKQYGLKVGDLVGPSRRKQNVAARSVAIYLIRRLTDLSFQDIGCFFGDRDHTTVLHAYRKINHTKKSEPHIRDMIVRLSEKLVN